MPTHLSQSLSHPSRLAAIHASRLIGAPPSEAFDRLTSLVTRFLGVPTALVTLVEPQRQFLVSCQGVAEPWASARETPLSHSFCQHVVATGDALIVEDARKTPLVCDNLAVRDLNVIAYAGIPLVTSDGEVLGSFCAIDSKPRVWSEQDITTLRELARSAVSEIELRIATRTLADREQELAKLLDQTSELICATDNRGNITHVNHAWTISLGYTAEEARSVRPIDLVAQEHRQHYVESALKLRAGEFVSEFEAVLIAKDGHRVVCRGRGSPHFEDGKVVGAYAVYRDVTEERRAEHTRARLVATLEASPDFVAIAQRNGDIVYLNRAGRELVGVGENASLVGVKIMDLCPERESVRMQKEILPTALRDRSWQGEGTLLGGSGVEVPVLVTAIAHPSVRANDEQPYFMSIVARDLRERVESERALRESEMRFRAAREGSLDSYLALRSVRDANGVITDFEILDANTRAADFVGISPEEMIGRFLCELWPVMRERGLFDTYARVAETRVVFEEERETIDPRFRGLWLRLQVVPLDDGVAITSRDITERKALEEQVRFLAERDELTGLFNRRGFLERAESELSRACLTGEACTLLYGDLNDFKQVNDTYGHAEGDMALCMAANVLRDILCDNDIVARIGGDEFTVLVVGFERGEALNETAIIVQRIQAEFAKRAFGVADNRVSMSFGTAMFDPIDPMSLDELMRTADAALYTAKRGRRSPRAAA